MSIASVLFSESQRKLFLWLFGQPERAFHLNELRRLTGLGSATLQRELNRLAAAGLLSTERIGNLRRFQANAASPVFKDLIELTRKTIGMEPLLREALAPLQPRLKAAWIYGSVAKRSDTASSDIDLMLIGEQLTLAETLECLLPAERQLGRKINPVLYSPADFQRRRAEPDSFINRVLSQPVMPLIGGPDDADSAG